MASFVLFLCLKGPNHPIDRWSGFLLMNLGETGNFISYAFAPASMVAPLGTVSSCLVVDESACCQLLTNFPVRSDGQLLLRSSIARRAIQKGRPIFSLNCPIYTNVLAARSSWSNNCYYRGRNGRPGFQCI
jgi:hypothetical protein